MMIYCPIARLSGETGRPKNGTKARHTYSTKINRPGHNIRMYWTNFDSRPFIYNNFLFEKKRLLKLLVHTFTLLLAPFAPKFAAQWVFETCLKFNKSLSSKENVDDFGWICNKTKLIFAHSIGTHSVYIFRRPIVLFHSLLHSFWNDIKCIFQNQRIFSKGQGFRLDCKGELLKFLC